MVKKLIKSWVDSIKKIMDWLRLPTPHVAYQIIKALIAVILIFIITSITVGLFFLAVVVQILFWGVGKKK